MTHPSSLVKILGFAAVLLASSFEPVARAADTRVFVIAGGEEGDPASTLSALQKRLDQHPAESTVLVFTGNYLPRGEFPSPSSKSRDAAEQAMEPYLAVARALIERGGRVFFLPGHRDYAGKGRKGPRRLREFLEEALQDEDDEADDDALSVMPVSDCAEVALVELDDGVTVLAFVNSQWWMQDFDLDAKANQGCELKRRSQLSLAFEGAVKKYRTKRLVVLSHHPLRSNGPFGGQFGPVEYFWPPVVGFMSVVVRQAGLVPQYLGHPLYASYADSLKDAAEKFGAVVFASGHDRSLQILSVKSQLQIVSGAGSERTSRVNSPSDEREHAASVAGWAEIAVGPDGEGTTELVEAATAKVLFQRALPELPSFEAESPEPKARPPGKVASTYTRTSFGTTNFLEAAFLGRHYRDAYDLDLEFDQLQLKERGFTPIRVGGGAQTNSLRLVDEEGGQWSLRASTKDSSRFLPYPLGKISFVSAIVDDAFTASHPGAALAVPPLAEAVGIFHTRPKLLFVPDQRALEPYRGYLSDEVALLERRPEELDEGDLPEHLGGGASDAGKIKYDSSVKVLEKLRAKPWKYSVDQENMLRARLLDMLIGDWDRHEDQWRWVRIPQPDGRKVFRPIPRDRDQVFANYDGFFLAIGRLAAPEIRVLGTFGHDIGDPTWLNYGARHIDSHFLNGIDRERWLAVAREVQAAVTDERIDEGLSRLQPAVLELDGKEIREKLIQRREGLVKAAELFYEQLSEKVVVLGSDKRDLIHVTFAPEGKVRLELRRGKEGPSATPYYDRLFDPEDTEEVHIYSFSGKDELEVFGEPHGKIRIRYLGGRKKDVIRAGAPGEARLRAKAISIYDLPKGLEIDESIDVDDQRSKNAYRNQYDRKDPHYEPTKVGFIPGLLINPDDGVYLGGTITTAHPGFKRRPYDIQNTFSAYFATATLGINGSYDGLIPDSLFGVDQHFGVEGTTPQFTRNFFGLTNTFIDPSANRDFYRLRQSTVRVHYGPSGSFGSGLWRAGLDVEGIFNDTERTAGRNIDALATAGGIDARALTSRYFVGATAWIRLDSRDNSAYPKRGLFGELFASTRMDLTEDAGARPLDTLGLFGGVLGGVFPFDDTGRLVLSTRVRAQGIVGDYLFYWAPTLGANQLRAYNEEQLAGDFVVSHSTDLRLEVIRISGGLPGAIGLAGAIDHGRAFGTQQPGDEYHVSAGGTVFWNIADLAGLGFSYHVGLQDPGQRQRFLFLIGPLFSDTGFRP